jgi:hypothetical protein
MGIENEVKRWASAQGYDSVSYWERNKENILRRAGRHGKLEQSPVEVNASRRRYMRRHVEEFTYHDFIEAGLQDYLYLFETEEEEDEEE